MSGSSLCVCLKPQIIRVLIIRDWIWLHYSTETLLKSTYSNKILSSFAFGKLHEHTVILKPSEWKLNTPHYRCWALQEPVESFVIVSKKVQHSRVWHLHAATVFNWLLFFQSFCARRNSHWERWKDLEASAQGTVSCSPIFIPACLKYPDSFCCEMHAMEL